MTDAITRRESNLNSFLVVIAVVGVAAILLLAGGSNTWNAIMDSGEFSHDQKMWVETKGWAAGEYKKCTTQNVDLSEPTLHCDDDVVGKVFEVRFYGKTFVQDKPELTVFHWTCRRNVGIEPTMTCRDKK